MSPCPRCVPPLPEWFVAAFFVFLAVIMCGMVFLLFSALVR